MLFYDELEQIVDYGLSEKTIELINKSAEAVLFEEVDKVTIKCDQIKAVISLGTDGQIKIDRTITQKTNREIE